VTTPDGTTPDRTAPDRTALDRTALDRTALVTGAGTGIGAAVARRLVRDGVRVALVGRRPEPLAELAAELNHGGATVALPLPADAASDTEMRAVVAATVARFGGLDVLVANAGGEGSGGVVQASDEDWTASLRANLLTAVVSARVALPQLIARRGNVVLVSSIAGLAAPPQLAPYTTAKHALIGLMRSIARDHGPDGVRANAVCPGWVVTPMADAEMDALADLHDLRDPQGRPDRMAAYALASRDVPLRRPATADEVAAAVAFVAGPEASAISGVVLPVDGAAGAVDLPTLAFDPH